MEIIQKWAYQINSRGERKLVHVDNVDNGIACNCICTKCGSILIAVANIKGIQYKKVSHFAHANETSCKGETLAHIEAKSIIEKEGYLWLPRYTGKGNYDTTKVHFDKVLIEKEIIKPFKYSADLWCTSSKGSSIVVEIVVTHDLDRQKRKFLVENKIDTLSIYIGSSLQKEQYNDLPENFSNIVLKESKREWDVNRKIDLAKKEEAKAREKEEIAEQERSERKLKELKRKEQELEKKRKKRLLRSIGGPTYEEIDKRKKYDAKSVRKKQIKEMIKESERKVEREIERAKNPSGKSARKQNN